MHAGNVPAGAKPGAAAFTEVMPRWRYPKGQRAVTAAIILAAFAAIGVAGTYLLYQSPAVVAAPLVLCLPIVVAAFFFGYAGVIGTAAFLGISAGIALASNPTSFIATITIIAGIATLSLVGGIAAFLFQVVERRARLLDDAIAHDRITGLSNGEVMESDLGRQILRWQPGRPPITLANVQVERLDEVASTLGLERRDALLRQAARRLAQRLPASAALYHLETDSFGIVLGQDDAEDADNRIKDLCAEIRKPAAIDEIPFALSVAAGVARFPSHSRDLPSLHRAARAALAVARSVPDHFSIYDPARDRERQEAFELIAALPDAIRDNQLQLHYQPKIDLRSGHCIGAEALVRWRHPVRGMVPPGLFVPAVEQTSLIHDVTLWVMEEALAQLAAWRKTGIDLTVAINMSARDLEDHAMPTRMTEMLTHHGVEPWRLEVELTETAAMVQPERALTVLSQIRSAGVGIAIDDFGTGQSSLAYLAQLPADLVKVDQIFASRLEREPHNSRIIRTAVDLAQELGISVLVEGIETAETVELLRAMTCDQGQGYHFARPMPAPEFESWLHASPWGLVAN